VNLRWLESLESFPSGLNQNTWFGIHPFDTFVPHARRNLEDEATYSEDTNWKRFGACAANVIKPFL